MDKHISEILNDALTPLPWPCHLHNAPGTDEIYLTWYLQQQTDSAFAGNRARRGEQIAQVSIYSRRPVIDELQTVVQALRAAGLRISVNPSGYDSTTRLYNTPIIVRHALKTNLLNT